MTIRNPVLGSYGQYGATFLTSSTPGGSAYLTGSFCSIYTLTACVFKAWSGSFGGFTIGSDQIPASVQLNGEFSAIQLASGSAIVYNDSTSITSNWPNM